MMSPMFCFGLTTFHTILAAFLVGVNAHVGWDLMGGLGVAANFIAAVLWYAVGLEGRDDE